MSRRRCPRGHFLPADARVCRCARRRRTYWGGDLDGQGLERRGKHRITTVPLTGSYL
ncbi:hypothetical protein ACH4JS_34935 [Streptomyces sp. NPDC017638]|uniref:hypothetical protein n=1 Tax=unclassified Streptomyces TaxID=2593676 RepID=UPI002965F32C|nr:hypothetical protein [Streptomyces sp. SCL15-4]